MCYKKYQTPVIIFILCLLFSSPKLPAQQNIKKIPAEITENLQVLKKAGTVEEKLNAYTELAWLYRKTNVGLAEAYSDSTIKYALILKKYPTYWLGLNSKGEALSAAGKLEKSFKVHMAALEVAESRSLTIKKAHSLNNIGLLFKKQKNYKSAREYIYKASIIYNSLNDTTGIVTTANNIGNCFYHTFIYDSAIIYYNKAIYYAGITKNLIALGNGYTNIGHCYYYMDEFQKAKKFYYQGMQYRLKAGSPGDISDSYSNYAYMLNEEGNYSEAEKYYKEALALNKQVGNKERLGFVYSYISQMALAKKDYKSAYYYADTCRKYRDSILNDANVASLNELSQRFDTEKKQLQISQLSTENEFKKKENKLQKIFLIAVGLALMASLCLGIFVYKQYKAKNKANQIIGKQKELLEEKQKEIVDSITYAKHLQEAILPPLEYVKEFIPNSFILYKPKDIVAGDFYWMEYKDGLVFIAAADCTGHGVPGAMVSVVCSNALHRAVNEFGITDPGKILDKAREFVLETFDRSNKNVKDGMDISLCCINLNTKSVLWSGANNPLWYIQNNEMKEIGPDKQAIGKTENSKPFTTHTIKLSSGDSLFLFTDGFADQFGGVKGKKLKYKPFKDLLINTSMLTSNEQKQKLETDFNEWKGSLEQVDDVCIIGIRL